MLLHDEHQQRQTPPMPGMLRTVFDDVVAPAGYNHRSHGTKSRHEVAAPSKIGFGALG